MKPIPLRFSDLTHDSLRLASDIRKFAEAMGMAKFTPAISSRLVRAGIINSVVDIFLVTVNDMSSATADSSLKIKDKDTYFNSVLDSVHRSKEITFSKFIRAIFLLDISEKEANRLAKEIGTLENMLASKIYGYFSREVIDGLLKAEVIIQYEVAQEKEKSKKKQWSYSDEYTTISKEDFRELIEFTQIREPHASDLESVFVEGKSVSLVANERGVHVSIIMDRANQLMDIRRRSEAVTVFVPSHLMQKVKEMAETL